jgi:hypothetical protein
MPSSVPKDQIEQEIVLRKFDGVNLLVDQAYLGPSYLRRASNWIPGETFRLTKAPGNSAYGGGNLPTFSRVLRMVRVYSGANRYLYVVGQVAAGTGDEMWVSTVEGAWAQVQLSGGGNLVFTQVGGVYDIEELNGTLYIGNGVDAIYSLPIGSTATALSPIDAFTDGSSAPSKTSDPGAQWLTGTYAFAWAIFDNQVGVWRRRVTRPSPSRRLPGSPRMAAPCRRATRRTCSWPQSTCPSSFPMTRIPMARRRPEVSCCGCSRRAGRPCHCGAWRAWARSFGRIAAGCG